MPEIFNSHQTVYEFIVQSNFEVSILSFAFEVHISIIMNQLYFSLKLKNNIFNFETYAHELQEAIKNKIHSFEKSLVILFFFGGEGDVRYLRYDCMNVIKCNVSIS